MALEYMDRYAREQALIEQLAHESEDVMSAYEEYRDRVLGTGALSHHVKQLIALGITLALGGDDEVVSYLHDALKAGASRSEVLETIGVAVLMGGTPALGRGSKAWDAMNQL